MGKNSAVRLSKGVTSGYLRVEWQSDFVLKCTVQSQESVFPTLCHNYLVSVLW